MGIFHPNCPYKLHPSSRNLALARRITSEIVDTINRYCWCFRNPGNLVGSSHDCLEFKHHTSYWSHDFCTISKPKNTMTKKLPISTQKSSTASVSSEVFLVKKFSVKPNTTWGWRGIPEMHSFCSICFSVVVVFQAFNFGINSLYTLPGNNISHRKGRGYPTHWYTSPKTTMTIKHPPFEDVFPIENGGFSSYSC